MTLIELIAKQFALQQNADGQPLDPQTPAQQIPVTPTPNYALEQAVQPTEVAPATPMVLALAHKNAMFNLIRNKRNQNALAINQIGNQ